MTVPPRWSASRIGQLIALERDRRKAGAIDSAHEPQAAPTKFDATSGERLLDQLTWANHHEFVEHAYRVLAGRPPTVDEYLRSIAALLGGNAKTWLLGQVRYSADGRARAVHVPGLRYRYLAQRLFRIRMIGPVAEWLYAIVCLPRLLRHLRAVTQILAGEVQDTEQSVRALARRQPDSDTDLSGSRVTATTAGLVGTADAPATTADLAGTGQAAPLAIKAEIDNLMTELAATRTQLDVMTSRFNALLPPPLQETFEVEGGSLIAPARERLGITEDAPTSALSSHTRYALFEASFYDSALVMAKQRVYLRYLNREAASNHPFLDLGCGRGEFLRILREERIEAIGVDINPVGLRDLRESGFKVVEQDILEFLAADRQTYSGASLLQVAEHLTADQIERLLALVAPRLAPGAPLLVETPNPLSPFALGQFHTDPTHVAPIPPERLRFSAEAAGFERTRTLFQARVPGHQVYGPDPRTYYMDYAIIGYRPAR